MNNRIHISGGDNAVGLVYWDDETNIAYKEARTSDVMHFTSVLAEAKAMYVLQKKATEMGKDLSLYHLPNFLGFNDGLILQSRPMPWFRR